MPADVAWVRGLTDRDGTIRLRAPRVAAARGRRARRGARRVSGRARLAGQAIHLRARHVRRESDPLSDLDRGTPGALVHPLRDPLNSGFPQPSLTTSRLGAGEPVCARDALRNERRKPQGQETLMTIAAPAAALVLTMLVASPIAAQTSGERIPDAVKRGLTVSIIDDQGRQIDGRVESVSEETIRVSLRKKSEEVPLDRIVRIDRPDSLRNGALIGLGFGVAAGDLGRLRGQSDSTTSSGRPWSWPARRISWATHCWARGSTRCSTTGEHSMSEAGVPKPACRTGRRARNPRRGGIVDVVAGCGTTTVVVTN